MIITAKKAMLFSVLALAFSMTADKAADAGGATKIPAAVDAAADSTTAADVQAAPLAEADGKKVEVTDASFRCLHKMTKVRSMYVDNLLGDIQGTLAVANSADGGAYPPGSVLQLFPGEVMVKREKGTNPASNDWEFFTLDVTADGAKITQRGFDPEKPVKNMFGPCLSCHSQAAPKWDMVCEKGHGCPPINFPGGINSAVLTTALQKTDKRCPSPDPLTEVEIVELGKLKKLLEAQAAAAGGQQ
jgi:hypothetical protein